MEYELKHGQALVITGPQGSGKTILARQIAAQHGTFAEIYASELESDFGLDVLFFSKPNTLIIEDFYESKKTVAKVKELIASREVLCNLKFQEPVLVNSPNIIFCSGDVKAIHLAVGDRQFSTINLRQGASEIALEIDGLTQAGREFGDWKIVAMRTANEPR